jgi:hypothetical protein
MANKEISQLELTDRDLYWIALSIESHINHRDTYFTKKSAREYNKMVMKIRIEGYKRKTTGMLP